MTIRLKLEPSTGRELNLAICLRFSKPFGVLYNNPKITNKGLLLEFLYPIALLDPLPLTPSLKSQTFVAIVNQLYLAIIVLDVESFSRAGEVVIK